MSLFENLLCCPLFMPHNVGYVFLSELEMTNESVVVLPQAPSVPANVSNVMKSSLKRELDGQCHGRQKANNKLVNIQGFESLGFDNCCNFHLIGNVHF